MRPPRAADQATLARLATLRETIAALEVREAELLADIATLEAAIGAMRRTVQAHEAPLANKAPLPACEGQQRARGRARR